MKIRFTPRQIVALVVLFLLAAVSAFMGAKADAATPQPHGPSGNWTLIWHDEFNGTALNLNKWRPNWLAGNDKAITKPVNSAEYGAYAPSQVTVANGNLRLKAEKRTVTDDHGKTYPYVSGLVESSHDFQFTHGFAEARMRLPVNQDPDLAPVGSAGPNWPAFWLNGESWPEDGEIDVMEVLSSDNVAWHYHWGSDSNHRQAGDTPDGWDGDMPGTGPWHTFGVKWTASTLAFYYDGRLVGTHREGVTSSPHYLILNLALSGDHVKVPQTVRVAYVRVWRLP